MSVFEQAGPSRLKQSTTTKRACPGCLATGAIGFYHLSDQPVHVGVTYASQAEARCATIGEIDLCYCSGCRLIFNAAFDASKLDYTPGYDASLTSSDQFIRFLDSIIDRLIDRYRLGGKTVLEVGCGAGHFLRRLCQRAGCHGIGIDPALPRESIEQVGDHTIRWIRSRFGPEHADLPCDLLCGLDMFEHLPEPYAFLRSLRAVLPRAGGTPVYFESPNRDHVFDAGSGWSVYYEQCAHYDVPTIHGLFARSGFEVVHVAPCERNTQCLSIEAVAKPVDPSHMIRTSESAGVVPRHLATFGVTQQQRVRHWQHRLADWSAAGKDVVLWGSGGKGINFLNTVPGAERIGRVVDVNPARQGRYLPRAGQRIIAPVELIDAPPSVVLISNRLWHDEIAGTIAELTLDCELFDV